MPKLTTAPVPLTPEPLSVRFFGTVKAVVPPSWRVAPPTTVARFVLLLLSALAAWTWTMPPPIVTAPVLVLEALMIHVPGFVPVPVPA